MAACEAAAAQERDKAAVKGKAYSDPRPLVLSPSPATVPALRFRLLPLESQRTPGDAAPVYIRLGAKVTTAEKEEIGKKSEEWRDPPPPPFSAAAAPHVLEQRARTLPPLHVGATRRPSHS